MSEPRDEDREQTLWQMFSQPALRSYIFIGVSALIVYYMLMSVRGGGLGTLLAVVCAVPGLIFRWIVSPALFLIFMTYQLLDPNFMGLNGYLQGDYYQLGSPPSKSLLNDVLLTLCVVAYLMAQYRVLSFVHQSMPNDAAPRRRGQPEPKTPRRPFHLYGEAELLPMLSLGLFSVLLGVLIEIVLNKSVVGLDLGGTWGVTRSFARFMLFLWIIATLMVLTGAFFQYLSLRRMSRVQARLLLQDLVWQETRREQERIHRWRRWATSRASSPSRGPTSSSWKFTRRLILWLIIVALVIALVYLSRRPYY